MIYQNRYLLTKEEIYFLNEDKMIEYAIRRCINEMLNNIPLADLKMAFKVIVIDPESPSSILRLPKTLNTDEIKKMWEKRHHILKTYEQIEIDVELDIPSDANQDPVTDSHT
jgi:hypothetical protein